MRVFDCFTFFNELDLLEIRMNVLRDVVDFFVIVEGNRTYSGQVKEFTFERNTGRFDEFKEKVIYVKVDDFPNDDIVEASGFGKPWAFESFQRNAIERGLKYLRPDDVVLIGDVDEIPDPRMVVKYKGTKGIKVFHQRMYYYFINYFDVLNPVWKNGTKMGCYEDLLNPKQSLSESGHYDRQKDYGRPHYFRSCKGLVVSNGGWHFSFLGGMDAIKQKISSFAHQEYNKQEFLTEEHINSCLKSGRDLFNRRGHFYIFTAVDRSYPQYLLENIEKYRHLIAEEPRFSRKMKNGILKVLFGLKFFRRIQFLQKLAIS